MGNVTAIPEGKGTPEEKAEYEAFKNGDANLRHKGINVGKEGFYDPDAGSSYDKNERPDSSSEEPVLATDKGQPKVKTPKVISRDRNPDIDRSDTAHPVKAEHTRVDNGSPSVVDSNHRATGRKASQKPE